MPRLNLRKINKQLGVILAKVILLIEAKKADELNLKAKLSKKGFVVYSANTSAQAIEVIHSERVDVIVINALSFDTNGVRLTAAIDKRNHQKLPIILLVGAPLKIQTRADLVLTSPVTVQKLVNRFSLFFPKAKSAIIEVGPIALDTENRLVTCYEKTTQLTPKLLSILQILIENKDMVVERNELFAKGWDTNYLGDTRTLDVHISWLRNALEIDPSDPKLITTVRGVGFMLVTEK